MIWINKFIYWCPINIVSNRIHKNRDMKKKLFFLVWLWGIVCLAFGQEEFEKKVFAALGYKKDFISIIAA